jgi:preprotein translocase subunit SecG
MVISLTIIHVLMCFAIIGIVLLQAGKGADIGSAFGGAGSQAVFGSMGTPTLLGKITTSVAILFRGDLLQPGHPGRRASSSVVREPAPIGAPATSALDAGALGAPQSAPTAPAPPSAPKVK